MTPAPLSAVAASLLEKVAADNGFDRGPTIDGAWLRFASTQCPLRLALASAADAAGFFAAVSQRNVAEQLGRLAPLATEPPPLDSVATMQVASLEDLHRFVRRAFQLARVLPNELLHEFEDVTAALPRATEAERLVVQRVGQDVFRRGLLEFWQGRCAITGLDVDDLLRASHVKPWADCASDAERLDVHNGILLAAHLDAAFDRGLITVGDDGTVLASPRLDAAALRVLGLEGPRRVTIVEGHARYLAWHRERVFHGE